ncbi:hypothetical protein AC1031_015505 [Aphanomyces cochlioides]|nr:hypothetical protein AC1031_015505 [Aphanomyces cochlioides]
MAEASPLQEAITLIASQSPLVAAEGLNKLVQLTFNQSRIKVQAGECGAITAIVDAMKRSQENGSMQEDGCRALRTVAFHCDPNLNLVQQEGAIDAVATALKLHRSNEAVVAEGFWALVVFCANHHGNTLVAKNLINVSDLMVEHVSNAEIQKKGMFLNVIFG